MKIAVKEKRPRSPRVLQAKDLDAGRDLQTEKKNLKRIKLVETRPSQPKPCAALLDGKNDRRGSRSAIR